MVFAVCVYELKSAGLVFVCVFSETGFDSELQTDNATQLQYRFMIYQRVV